MTGAAGDSRPQRAEPADVEHDEHELDRFADWVLRHRGLRITDYTAMHEWSVDDADGFWSAIADFYDVHFHTPPVATTGTKTMPGTAWFPQATLNYAEQALRWRETFPGETAVIGFSQSRERVELTWAELADHVARARHGLQRLGLRAGDRVVGYLPNTPEAVIAMLATASLGAIWASCAPEFGARSVVDRFAQIEPTVLLAVPGYHYGEKFVSRVDEVEQIRAGLPSLSHVVSVPYAGQTSLARSTGWESLLSEPVALAVDPVPFDHPLFVLFSSGTTGKPKAIVHGHGGITLEHLKNHGLSWDLRPGDRMLWFSTTSWMMWNSLVSGLLLGATIVLVDGNPVHPDLSWQWRLAAQTRATLMGASPGFLMACRRAGLRPAQENDLSSLRQIGAAGSPLAAEGYEWIDEQFPGVLLNVGSGGTDLCSAILQGSPWQPVVPGEISGPALGVAAASFDPDGLRVVDELGELVITAPLPSMPLGFWGDDGTRYLDTYFSTYPDVWRHGDWVRFRSDGAVLVAGRSDATLNRGGVRLGTSEFYGILEEMPEVADSLVVHLEDPDGGNGVLVLFVVLADQTAPDSTLQDRIVRTLRTGLSPRHVPDALHYVPSIPRSRTGKKLELPAKRVLLGEAVDDVASREVLVDPSSLDAIAALAPQR